MAIWNHRGNAIKRIINPDTKKPTNEFIELKKGENVPNGFFTKDAFEKLVKSGKINNDIISAKKDEQKPEIQPGIESSLKNLKSNEVRSDVAKKEAVK